MRFLLAVLAVTLTAAAPTDLATSIRVLKSARQMLLLRNGEVIKRYAIALGGSPVGHKQREGDRRTPEGSYTISGRNPKSSYHLSLRISYPNEADRARAAALSVAPGGDIMIHGLPNGLGSMGAKHREEDWTDGCIAVTDAEIEEIWALVPDGTPIRIDP
jgi:murein L,D-transpeptidase YafK